MSPLPPIAPPSSASRRRAIASPDAATRETAALAATSLAPQELPSAPEPLPQAAPARPAKPDARARLLDAARDAFRRDGYAATAIDDLCRAAGVTKGAFFHHFRSKEDLARAAVARWGETTGALFAGAPYADDADPVLRVFGYLAFRRALAFGEPAAISCLLGALAQETAAAMPALRGDLWAGVAAHVDRVAADLAAAKAARVPDAAWNPREVALFTQATLQGAFILAKAKGDSTVARDMIAMLERYVASLLALPAPPILAPRAECASSRDAPSKPIIAQGDPS